VDLQILSLPPMIVLRARLVRITVAALAYVGAAAVRSANGQELEPGLYQNAPPGVSVAAFGYSFSTGNVLFDAALPIEGVTARVHVLSIGFVRSLSLFGRAAKVDAQLPMSWSAFQGEVGGMQRTRSPTGLADPRLRIGVNFIGGRLPSRGAPAAGRRRTIAGASLQLAVPLGQYDSQRLINIGAHRWSFRPEVGLSHARGRLTVEAAAGAWLFTRNTEFFGNSSLTQRPLYFVKANAIYTFRRNLWASASYGHATGGQTRIDDASPQSLQRNNRIGLAVSLPARGAASIKFVWTSGLTTRLGSDFDSVGIVYQFVWGPRRVQKEIHE
jgi:hypothetical protein